MCKWQSTEIDTLDKHTELGRMKLGSVTGRTTNPGQC